MRSRSRSSSIGARTATSSMPKGPKSGTNIETASNGTIGPEMCLITGIMFLEATHGRIMTIINSKSGDVAEPNMANLVVCSSPTVRKPGRTGLPRRTPSGRSHVGIGYEPSTTFAMKNSLGKIEEISARWSLARDHGIPDVIRTRDRGRSTDVVDNMIPVICLRSYDTCSPLWILFVTRRS